MKVEWTYSLGEHEGMSNQLKALEAREDQLGMEVGELVAGVVREEFLSRQLLERYVTAYNHESLALPPPTGPPNPGPVFLLCGASRCNYDVSLFASSAPFDPDAKDEKVGPPPVVLF
ncbi:hypothetical protein JCM1841_001279 [Sporobolomyces salmonicolor]